MDYLYKFKDGLTIVKDDMPLNKEINEKINGRKLVVVGYYDSKYNYNYYFVNDNTIKYNLIKKNKIN